jgi:hypothetical protein
MDPSTEQLIRDYLNRVAVAARSSMGPDEVRAFLARMHDSIERQCAAYGGPSTAEVSSALAAMGEPTALVGRERARLTAARAGLDAGSPHPAGRPAATAAATAAATGSPTAAVADTATDSPTDGRAVTTGAAAVATGTAAVATGTAAVTTVTPAVTTGTLPSAQRTGDTAPGGSGGRPLRLPGTTRRNAGRRSGQPGAEAGPGADPVSARTASQRAVQRRSVTARRRPAELLIDSPAASKNAVRPRGPQGRDSPVLLPLKRNLFSTQDPPADPEPWRDIEPDPPEQPGTALAFVVEPPQDPQANVVIPPKFQPVREPAAWPASSPGRRRGASRGPEPGASRGPEPGASRGPEPGTELGPEPGIELGSAPDTEAGPEPDPGHRPEQHTERGPEPGAGRRPVRRPGPIPAGQPRDGLPRRRVVTRTASSRMASSRMASSRIESSPRERVAASVGVFIQRAPGLARQHPLECVAVILLGLGGLIFPPVWLLGAVVALPSRLWDIKDKLTGLAAPAVVTIVGGAGLAMGSSHTSGGAYFHEALIIGGYLIRAGSVLGAGYLAWRVQRGQRQPAEPPWRRQYR